MTEARLDSAQSPRRRSLREQEAELNARASILDSEWDIGFIETVKVIARGWMFVNFFWGRFFLKWILLFGALMYPVFVLPWGVKIVVDHVVLNQPITSTDGFPGWLHILIHFFMGMPPVEILTWLTGISVFLVVFVGAYGPPEVPTTRRMVVWSKVKTPLPSRRI